MIVASSNSVANFIIPLMVGLPGPSHKHSPVSTLSQSRSGVAAPMLGLASQPRSPSQQSQGGEEASDGAVWKLRTSSGELEGRPGRRQASLDPGHSLRNPEVWHPTSQGARLEVSNFLLFQTGIVTLVGPPLSMSPQSRYLILLPPILLAWGLGVSVEGWSNAWVRSMSSTLLIRKAWFPWEPRFQVGCQKLHPLGKEVFLGPQCPHLCNGWNCLNRSLLKICKDGPICSVCPAPSSKQRFKVLLPCPQNGSGQPSYNRVKLRPDSHSSETKEPQELGSCPGFAISRPWVWGSAPSRSELHP